MAKLLSDNIIPELKSKVLTDTPSSVKSQNVDWTTLPFVTSCARTGNQATVQFSVKLPKSASSIYYLKIQTVGNNSNIVIHYILLNLSDYTVHATKASDANEDITEITASNYNAANSTIDLKITYSGKVYWELVVDARNILFSS